MKGVAVGLLVILTISLFFGCGGDNQGPTVAILSPTGGGLGGIGMVSGTTEVIISAFGPEEVSKIEIYVDGKLVDTITPTSELSTWEWDTTQLTFQPSFPFSFGFSSDTGQHTLSAKAYDTDGNADIATVTVFVSPWKTEGNKYTNYQYRFEITTIDGWTASTNIPFRLNDFISRSALVVLSPHSFSSSYGPALSILTPMNVESLAALEKQLEATMGTDAGFSQLEVSDSEDITVANIPAKKIPYKMSEEFPPSSRAVAQGEVLFFLKDGKGYTIWTIARHSIYELHAEDFQAIISSIKFF